jgi:serine/threonine protein kinase
MPSLIDDYLCHKTLGAGISAKVKLATHLHSQQKVALKIYDKSNPLNEENALKTIYTEVEALSILNHAYLVKVIEYKEDAIWKKTNHEKLVLIRVAYVVLELINGGMLFDYIALESFDEKICRFYFKQMLSVMHHMHSSGVSHRDLKPENIMLDD